MISLLGFIFREFMMKVFYQNLNKISYLSHILKDLQE
jgi:hypothetical protein